MIEAGLLQFLRDGSLGPIALDASLATVEAVIPSAEQEPPHGRCTRRRSGDVELLFAKGTLGVIELAAFTVPTGGPDIALDPWIVRTGMTRATFERALQREGIPFHEPDPPRGYANGVSLLVGPGIWVGFLGAPIGEWSGLFSLSWAVPDWSTRADIRVIAGR